MRAPATVALCAGLVASLGASRASHEDPVTIGLFLPSKGPAAVTARQVRAGAGMAIERANREGGVHGRRLALSESVSDLTWDRAARELVDLIYSRRAVAVVGALDSRSGHLAEQVVTRARGEAVFLTPWASEPSLTQIRIPWFFRLVPDDDRQAGALAAEIFSVRGIRRVAVWVGRTADARAAARGFVHASPPDSVAEFGAEAGIGELVARTGAGEFGAVLLYAPPAEAADVASRIRTRSGEVLLAGPLWLNEEAFVGRGRAVEGTLLVSPCAAGSRTGPEPPAVQYGHDAVHSVVEALRRAAPPDGRGLAAALLEIRAGGLTGELRFDGRGQRLGGACLSVVSGSRP